MPNELHEIHKWEDALLPFIYHHDSVTTDKGFTGNWHDSLEVLCTTSGSGTLICNRRRAEMRHGVINVIDSDAVHLISSETGVEYHCFIISKKFCLENGIDVSKRKYALSVTDGTLFNAVGNISDAWKDKKSEWRIPAVRSLALSVLLALTRDHSELSHTAENEPSDFIRLGLAYINNNFTSPVTLDAISGAANVSKYHFLREFKSYMGCTVTEYVNMRRCSLAAELLSHGGAKVSAVAHECGFENLSYFSKTYKKYMGVLPSQKNSGSI